MLGTVSALFRKTFYMVYVRNVENPLRYVFKAVSA
jgi:hypothetical protein